MSIEYKIVEMPDRDIAMLHVEGHLDFDSREKFKQALKSLHDFKRDKLVIDLSRVTGMSSLYIGSLMDFGNNIGKDDRNLSVMLTPVLHRVCTQVGLDSVVNLITVKE